MNRVAGILSLGIALAAGAVQAQERVMTADVPFMFYVGSTMMHQGAYRVDEMSNSSLAWIRSQNGDAVKAVATIGLIGKEQSQPKLVFRHYGEDYFLAEIWSGTGTNGWALPRTRREKELARSGAVPTLAVIRIALH